METRIMHTDGTATVLSTDNTRPVRDYIYERNPGNYFDADSAFLKTTPFHDSLPRVIEFPNVSPEQTDAILKHNSGHPTDDCAFAFGMCNEDGGKEGLWKTYNKRAKSTGFFLEQEKEYKNGVLHGDVVTYFSNGRVQSKKSYNEGALHGSCVTYDTTMPDVCTLKGDYVEGKPQGKFQWIDRFVQPAVCDVDCADEKLTITGLYDNGLRQGLFVARDSQNRVREEVSYKDGAVASPHKMFDENGLLTHIELPNVDVDMLEKINKTLGDIQLANMVKNGFSFLGFKKLESTAEAQNARDMAEIARRYQELKI